MLRDRFAADHTLVVDAGIGAPSHAAAAMELGYDAVLLNTAVSKAKDPAVMAGAFAKAVEAGRAAYLAGVIEPQTDARASTPMIDKPFWHQQEN
jgi:thiazole synthase